MAYCCRKYAAIICGFGRPLRAIAYYNPAVGEGRMRLSNRGPGEKSNYDAREIIDPGFLELVRYGIRSPHDPLIVDSLKVVDAVSEGEHPVWTMLAPL